MPTTIERSLEIAKEYDLKRFDQSSWLLKEWRDQKTGHIVFHIAKAALKIVAADLPTIRQQVIPDLGYYRNQIVTLFELPVEEVVILGDERAPSHSALEHVTIANGELGYYLEPRQHDEVTSPDHAFRSAVHLHSAATKLARDFAVEDVDTAVVQRLQEHAKGAGITLAS